MEVLRPFLGHLRADSDPLPFCSLRARPGSIARNVDDIRLSPLNEVESFFKIILALLVLVLAVGGGFALFGLVAWLFKWFVILGVITLAGVGAYKLLSKPDEPRLELSSAEAEMLKAEQMLAEIRQKQLTK